MPKTKWQAILGGNCPRCRKGKLFTYPLTKITHFSRTNETCPHCGLRYEVEPGFFFGAMYISYAITVALLVTVGIAITVLIKDPSIYTYIFTTIGITLGLIPFTYRISRILYLHWFSGVKFDEEKYA